MKNNYSHLPLKSLLPQFSLWQKSLDSNQIAHLHFLPYSGMLYRTYQFRDWYTKLSKEVCDLVDLDIELINEPHLLTQYLKNISKPTIIIARRIFVGDLGHIFAQALQDIAVQNRYGILVVHETTPLEIKKVHPYLPSVMHHQCFLYQPVNNKESLKEYCHNLSKDWGLKLNPQEFTTWYDYSQHQLLLYNELLRLRLASPDSNPASLITMTTFMNKCQLIWDNLPESYREYYFKNSSISEDLERELISFGLPLRYELASHPYLDHCVKNTMNQVLVISESSVKYKNIDITNIFTQTERLILAKLQSIEYPISREDIGKIYWPQNSDNLYSDWALDQLMSRLRKKIQQQHLPIIIRTLRGRGYVLSR